MSLRQGMCKLRCHLRTRAVGSRDLCAPGPLTLPAKKPIWAPSEALCRVSSSALWSVGSSYCWETGPPMFPKSRVGPSATDRALALGQALRSVLRPSRFSPSGYPR